MERPHHPSYPIGLTTLETGRREHISATNCSDGCIRPEAGRHGLEPARSRYGIVVGDRDEITACSLTITTSVECGYLPGLIHEQDTHGRGDVRNCAVALFVVRSQHHKDLQGRQRLRH
jgi:hypothetical protein